MNQAATDIFDLLRSDEFQSRLSTVGRKCTVQIEVNDGRVTAVRFTEELRVGKELPTPAPARRLS